MSLTDWNFAKKLGFGCMRLPMKDGEIDEDVMREMVDAFMAEGFNYFDTARGYHRGQSEVALKHCLTSRYPRESYILVNKLSGPYFNSEEELEPFFQTQLEACGVDYFDIYLMHAQEKALFEKFKRCRAYETALTWLKEGKIKHFGISFHDKPEVLEQILTEYPQIEVVQIQFNYADYEDPSVESRKVYEVCRKYGKHVIVMEPVKGGSLVRLPEQAQAILDDLHGGSHASYAIRFAAGFEGVVMVLSGMGSMEMLLDNTSYMKHFVPLDSRELDAVSRVCSIFHNQKLISCTACKYCVEGCPQEIPIPDLFACLNGRKTFQNWNTKFYYGVHTRNGGKASSCIGCGACEAICPQHLPIRSLLLDVVKEFEE